MGNFLPDVQRQLLGALAKLAGEDGSLLIGFDRIKDESVLLPAYDDAAGVTRAFEMNILERLQREAGAKLDPHHFRYEARWNAKDACVEMHLVARQETQIGIDEHRFGFAAGESIWNESSHKYDDGRIADLAASAGLVVSKLWTDDKNWFSLALLRPAP
jgi:uncharacterized SAM-dependent methyltransferase